MKIIKLFLISLAIFITIPFLALASNTDGTIDSAYKYAWGENIGWINFGTTNGNVHVTDSGLSGYALSETAGWINLNDVANDGYGNLTGYAWGENVGWIKFNPVNGGVTINSSGEFSGSALSETVGWIVFGGDYKVKTDWRPKVNRSQCNNGTDDDNDKLIDYPADPGCDSLTDDDERDGNASNGGGSVSDIQTPISASPIFTPKIEIPAPVARIISVPEKIAEEIKKVYEPIQKITEKIIDIFKPQPKEEEKIILPPAEETIQKETPLAMQGKWNLFSNKSLGNFVLAPLPKEIIKLAEKFPKLSETFKNLGISKLTDLEKLRDVKLTLLGLNNQKDLPAGVIFAGTAGKLIDFNMVLSFNDSGEPEQKITTVSGKTLQLSVRPDAPVKSVRGYLVFRSKTPSQPVSLELPFNHLVSSLIFANPVFAKIQEQPVRIEEKLVLLEFEYTDPDSDGIYTAEIQAPVVDGEYEIITVLNFEDPELGAKEIRLITVVDPEGYVYEKDGAREIRLPKAVVSLYSLNKNNQYELWPAKDYIQENPQTTDVTGKYSFLTPAGNYYLKVETPNYLSYQSESFEVKEGGGIHMNIELKPKYGWLQNLDWKMFILILFGLLLIYNFYQDRKRVKSL